MSLSLFLNNVLFLCKSACLYCSLISSFFALDLLVELVQGQAGVGASMALSDWARLLICAPWNLHSHGVHLSLLVLQLFVDQLLSLALSTVFVKSLGCWHAISIFHQLNNLLRDWVDMWLSHFTKLLVYGFLSDFQSLQVCIFQVPLLIAQKVIKIAWRLVLAGTLGRICFWLEVALSHLSGVLIFPKLSSLVLLEL